MRYPVYIAKRYLFSKSNRNAVNIISGIAVVAVILGSMALFIVLSGFSGLKHFALQFTNVFDSDLKISPAKGKTLAITPEQFLQLQEVEGVEAVSKVIEERVFLQYKGKNHITYIKGVDTQYQNVIPTDSILFAGDWLIPHQDEVVVGYGISSKLSLPPRDYGNLLEVYVPKPGTGQINILDPSSAFSKRKVVSSGVYEINDDLNSKYVFSDLPFARDLLGLDSLKVSYLEFKLDPMIAEENIVTQLSGLFPQEVVIKNRIQQNDALYKMLNAEYVFVYFFLSLIAAIAIFNLAGTIIMVILEKRGNIRTLYFLGLTIREIRRIFFYNGLMMTLLGVTIGLFLGAVAVLLQLWFGFVPITPTLAYPVRFNVLNLLLVLTTITALGALASKVASLKVTEKLLD
ncbi:MAG: ABC transporter permease [Flavobacteriaceae bacterium]|nr:ABC transporter permease [Flavobacteriaceae bacterium]